MRTNARVRKDFGLPWSILSDPAHEVGDQYGVAVSRKHPMAKKYQDGFMQPAMFVYRDGEPVYEFIQDPSLLNGYGAMNRPDPDELLRRASRA